MSYLGQPPAQGQRAVYRFVATQNQFTFTGLDAGSNTLSYVPGPSTVVFFNGRRLSAPDYVANDGISVNIVQGAQAGDEIIVVAESTFSVANVYSKAEADARYIRGNGSTASLNDSRSLAILTSKLRSSVSLMVGGAADGFKGSDGIDLANSSGAFVDTLNGALIGGIGAPMMVLEAASSLPKMTSINTTATGDSGYLATASTTYDGVANSTTYSVFHLFDGTGYSTYWDSQNGAAGQQWVQLQLPATKSFAGYALMSGNTSDGYAPTAFQLLGSIDGNVWTIIDTQVGQTLTAGIRSYYTIPAASRGLYQYYRLNLNAKGAGAYYQLYAFDLLNLIPQYESYPSIPAMTANNAVAGGTPGYTAFASSQDSAYPLLQPWKVFDQSADYQTSSWRASSTVLPQYIGQGFPSPMKFAGYAVGGYWDGTNNFYPTAWQLQGSLTNTGSDNWITLDTQAGVTFANNQRKTFPIPVDKQGLYPFYRLLVSAYVSNGSPLVLSTFDLLLPLLGVESQTTVPYHTSATQVVGGATGYAVMSSSASPSPSEPFRAFDGTRLFAIPNDTTNANYFRGSTGVVPQWITRQLPAAIKISAYRISSLGVFSPTAWLLQGSNTNSGNDWVTLDNRSLPGNFWSTDTVGDWKYFGVSTPGSYLYYRIYITNAGVGNGDGFVRLGEVEFFQGTSANMDLRSAVFPAVASPSKASLYLRLKANTGTIALNSNLIVSARRDRVNWTRMFLTQTGIRNGYLDLEANQADFGGDPGTGIEYRVQTNDGLLGLSIDGADLRWN